LLTKFFVADEGHDFLIQPRLFLRITNITHIFLQQAGRYREWPTHPFSRATATAIAAARLIPLPRTQSRLKIKTGRALLLSAHAVISDEL
jgi:hypothetical protein